MADPCQSLVDLVASLTDQVQFLRDEIANPDPNTPPSLLKLMRQQLARAERSLTTANIALKQCRAASPTPVYLKPSNTKMYQRFGTSVAVSGDTIAVGAWGETSGARGVNGDQNDTSVPAAGAVYVFVSINGVWSQQAYIKSSNTAESQFFGISVALSGDTLVVGASGESSSATGVDGNQNDTSAPSAGAAYVFVRQDGVWAQQAYLKASNTAPNQGFGQSVTISGNTIVVGAYTESGSARGVNGNQADNSAPGSGAAYVFVRVANVWQQQAYLKASNTTAGQLFGLSVSISGDIVIIGAMGESSSATGVNGNQNDNSAPNAGAAYIFVRTTLGPFESWGQEAYLKASDAASQQGFGFSVGVSGDTVVVGTLRTLGGLNAGAYVFRRSPLSIHPVLNPTFQAAFGIGVLYFWGQESTLTSTDVIKVPFAVAISGNSVIATSPFSPGAAYLFTRASNVWTPQTIFRAPSPYSTDTFGDSAPAFSEGLIVVGDTSESSDAIGVDGNQLDNSAIESGAAYVFSV